MATPPPTSPERRLPRRLPLVYFLFAHLSLGAACALVASDPRAFSGFFYHPRMLAAVHLVTLGWISSSILGALYLITPMALRARLPAGRLDAWAFAAFAVGVTGMAGHFWIDEPRGMIWGALLVTFTFLVVGCRTALALRHAPIATGVKLHLVLAFVNVLGAATLGILVGLDKVAGILPGHVLSHVYAHAHLAALGWGTMVVFGAAHRLFPMLLPAAMPGGRSLVVEALLLQAGILAVAAALLARGAWLGPAALLAAAGIASFFLHLGWMARHPRPRARNLPRPDWSVLGLKVAASHLALATSLGLLLALAPPAPWKIRLIPVYGTFGLLGFLGQMIAAVSGRLLPLFAWLRSFVASGYERQPPPPGELAPRPLAAAVFLLWGGGVPLLAAGFWWQRPGLVGAASWILLAAVGAGAGQIAAALRRSRRTRPWAGTGRPPRGAAARPPDPAAAAPPRGGWPRGGGTH